MRASLAVAAAALVWAHPGAASEIPVFLGPAASERQAAADDFVRAREGAPRQEFSVEEETVLKNAVTQAVDPAEVKAAARALGAFYLRHDLNVEALVALKAVDPAPDDREARFLIASAEYSLGRYADAAKTLGGAEAAPEGRELALYGMALARLGAYAKAGEALADASGPPAQSLASEFHLMRAASALAAGKTEAAATALNAAQPIGAASPLRREAAFYEALLHSAQNGSSGAKTWRGLARASDSVGARAALKLLKDEADAGAISRSEALQSARAISLRWRGGAVEREALFLIGALLGDAPEAFETLRRLAEQYAPADVAEAARERLTGMMARLALDEGPLSSSAKARLFYEMIDYAPPGAEGDALIRTVAGRLQALDLLAEAAELLEHQVFTRLRGAERAIVAADLAELYLDDGKPADARRVIAATRIAGLDKNANRRRLLLEAEALAGVDDGEASLALLDGFEAPEATQLRAGIYWRRNDWGRAAEAYRAIATLAPAPLSDQGRDTVLRAATAYLLAKDEAGLSAFNAEISQKIGADSAAQLLDALADHAKTAASINAYRQLYAEPGRSG
ncbi:MAG: hypothetical protein RIA10_14090 [Amphiplicatus sp.]